MNAAASMRVVAGAVLTGVAAVIVSAFSLL